MTRRPLLAAALTLALTCAPTLSHAQASAPPGQGDAFRDTSMLKLPPGAHAAIIEWEDLECPACAAAQPIVHQAIEHYHIPYIRYDFLIPGHLWSRQAAITARYLQDKVSADAAAQFRRDVFANQRLISSPDDLNTFTHRWFDAHHLQIPFVMDPNGLFAAEIQEDINLANRLGLQRTPTLIVVGPRGWTQVMDPSQLYTVIDKTLAESPAPRNTLRRPVSVQH